ncbi:GspH/FimT family pseudopilin [Lysobacter olei]
MPFQQRGFTLIELMVAVAVLAILAAIAFPSFDDFFDRYRVRGAADEVLDVISAARAQSVKDGLDAAVSSTVGSAWCVGANSASLPTGGAPAGAASACDCTVADACLVAGEELVVSAIKHPGVTMVGGTTFAFDGKLGVALTSSGVVADPDAIVLRSPKGKYDVSVNVGPLGQATLCTPTGKPSISGIAPC